MIVVCEYKRFSSPVFKEKISRMNFVLFAISNFLLINLTENDQVWVGSKRFVNLSSKIECK